MRVLLAEDNASLARATATILTKSGLEVERAADGGEALSMLRGGFYDVAVLDIMMPVMDGLEAARAIRALDRPDAATVPIVAASANAFDEDIKRSLSAGMNAHISQPIEMPTLVRTLAEVLRR